jgi:hypothetical protein
MGFHEVPRSLVRLDRFVHPIRPEDIELARPSNTPSQIKSQQIDHSSNQFSHFTRRTQIDQTQQKTQPPPPNTPPQIQNPDIDDPILSLVSVDRLLVPDPHVFAT